MFMAKMIVEVLGAILEKSITMFSWLWSGLSFSSSSSDSPFSTNLSPKCLILWSSEIKLSQKNSLYVESIFIEENT